MFCCDASLFLNRALSPYMYSEGINKNAHILTYTYFNTFGLMMGFLRGKSAYSAHWLNIAFTIIFLVFPFTTDLHGPQASSARFMILNRPVSSPYFILYTVTEYIIINKRC